MTVSSALGFCVECIRKDFQLISSEIFNLHRQLRKEDGLPEEIPHSDCGIGCGICGNSCVLGVGEIGYCGLKIGEKDRIGFISGTQKQARVSWYLDPLPTNCVSDWVCAGCSGSGFPEYSSTEGPEYGYYNLAVFYEACSFDCLFCQNWHYRRRHSKGHEPQEVVSEISRKVSCICFFGGDPGPQVIHALSIARLARRNQNLRICWETNGNISDKYLHAIINESLTSGGTIKVDVKAWSEAVNYALCGVSNRRTLEVVEKLLGAAKLRSDPPLVVISTLLVPGYVDENEVREIARFIASFDRKTPYSLLGFAPNFMMTDMPPTSVKHAQSCLAVAKDAGLERVHIGNRHLLGKEY